METSPSRKRVRLRPYSIYQWLVYVPIVALATFTGALMAVVLALLAGPRTANLYVAIPWCRLVAALAPMRLSIEGRENIAPGTGYVVVANHQSQFDIPAVYIAIGLDLRWVVKAELRRVPLIAMGCRAVGHIFVDRADPDQAHAAINRAVARQQPGTGVLFFAEGTRSRSGRILPFKKGAFRVAIDRRLPVLPVTVVGTRRILRPGSLQIHPGRARVIIHPPQATAGLGADDVAALRDRVHSIIAGALDDPGRPEPA